jgi:hypothetical protein
MGWVCVFALSCNDDLLGFGSIADIALFVFHPEAECCRIVSGASGLQFNPVRKCYDYIGTKIPCSGGFCRDSIKEGVDEIALYASGCRFFDPDSVNEITFLVGKLHGNLKITACRNTGSADTFDGQGWFRLEGFFATAQCCEDDEKGNELFCHVPLLSFKINRFRLNNLLAADHFMEHLTPVRQEQFCLESLELFREQLAGNRVYRQFVDQLQVSTDRIRRIQDIPFLPIGFFKSHALQTGTFKPEVFFESSGTTGSINSKHGLRSLSAYLANTSLNFREFYGDPAQYCFLALLPSYLERGNSSLVAMAHHLMQESGHPDNGFYLHELDRLAAKLQHLDSQEQPIVLLGVTYALLDLAEQFDLDLKHTIVMETGGMKGRKKEITREEMHHILRTGLGVKDIHSEYGMTELQSQAYSKRDGLFSPSSTMRVLLRAPDDPFDIWCDHEFPGRTGVVNVIDLANRDTQAFIATDDLARFTGDGAFEVLGRLDHCDIRGCSLLSV